MRSKRFRQVDEQVRSQHACTVREYILQRVEADPDLTLDDLAGELGVDEATIYRWLPHLEISVARGPRLIDRRAANPSDQPARPPETSSA